MCQMCLNQIVIKIHFSLNAAREHETHNLAVLLCFSVAFVSIYLSGTFDNIRIYCNGCILLFHIYIFILLKIDIFCGCVDQMYSSSVIMITGFCFTNASSIDISM